MRPLTRLLRPLTLSPAVPLSGPFSPRPKDPTEPMQIDQSRLTLVERETGIFALRSAYIAAVLVILLPPVQFSQIVAQ